MSLAGVRDGLKVVLATAESVRVYDSWASGAVPPGVVIAVDSIVDMRFGRGGDRRYTMKLLAIASRADDRSGLARIDEMLAATGARSLIAAIDSDPTLDGNASSAAMQSIAAITSYEFGGVDFLGAELTVDVIASD